MPTIIKSMKQQTWTLGCTVEVLPDSAWIYFKTPGEVSGNCKWKHLFLKFGSSEAGPSWLFLVDTRQNCCSRGCAHAQCNSLWCADSVHVLFSAVRSSQLKGVSKTVVQGINMYCAHFPVYISASLLQRQLLIDAVFTNHRAFLCLKLEWKTLAEIGVCLSHVFEDYRCASNMAMGRDAIMKPHLCKFGSIHL